MRVGFIPICANNDDVGTVLSDLTFDRISIRRLDDFTELRSIVINPPFRAQGQIGTVKRGDDVFVAVLWGLPGGGVTRGIYRIRLSDGVRTVINEDHIGYTMPGDGITPFGVRGFYVDANHYWVMMWSPGFAITVLYKIGVGGGIAQHNYPVGQRLHGLGFDGSKFWMIRADTRKIQRRTGTNAEVVELELDYPTGYETAIFNCVEVDYGNPTFLRLQGERGGQGVVVVVDTANVSGNKPAVMREWASADVNRWKDQQAASGEFMFENYIKIQSPTVVNGDVVIPVKTADNDYTWDLEFFKYAIVEGGVVGEYKPCTIKRVDVPFPWRIPYEEQTRVITWDGKRDLGVGRKTVSLHLKLKRV